jgi:hypothetical protein
VIEDQYIREIRPFLVVSNLGCQRVNRRDWDVTGKTSLAFSALIGIVGKSRLHKGG